MCQPQKGTKMKNHEKTIKRIREGWKNRIKARGYDVKRFCEEYDVNYNSFNTNSNPTIGFLANVEQKICELEASDNVLKLR